MLTDLKTILADTREKHYAVGLFNCVTLEMTKGILAAAEELRSPVIIGPAESLLPGASLAEYADLMLGMARRASVPVALHFDHGFTPELVEQAIRLGFSSVMYDCSMLPFGENLRRTREMALLAGGRNRPRGLQRLGRRGDRTNHLHRPGGRAALCRRERLRRAGGGHRHRPRRLHRNAAAQPVLPCQNRRSLPHAAGAARGQRPVGRRLPRLRGRGHFQNQYFYPQ